MPGENGGMKSPARRPATYEDIVRLPEGWVGQIVDGDLEAHPRPAAGHAAAAFTLGGELSGPFQRGRGGGPGGWWFFVEPELHLSRNILVPDLAGWRIERMPKRPPADQVKFESAPDWVCEILSPSTASLDRVKKRRVYEREGVSWLWFLDPVGDVLEAYALKERTYSPLGTWGPGETPRVAPFDAIALELDAIWDAPDAPSAP